MCGWLSTRPTWVIGTPNRRYSMGVRFWPAWLDQLARLNPCAARQLDELGPRLRPRHEPAPVRHESGIRACGRASATLRSRPNEPLANRQKPAESWRRRSGAAASHVGLQWQAHGGGTGVEGIGRFGCAHRAGTAGIGLRIIAQPLAQPHAGRVAGQEPAERVSSPAQRW